MAAIDIHALEAAYQAASQGADQPQYVLAPEGAFLRDADGAVTVFDFDAEGNHYPLSPEEQERRIAAFKTRLGLE